MRTLEDIYRCPKCSGVAAHGDKYCRSCGHSFTALDIEEMKREVHSVVGAIPWNTRDRYRCIHCTQFLCIKDSYCRGCGDQIDDTEKQLMKANLQELASKNFPSIIGLALFVMVVVVSLIVI